MKMIIVNGNKMLYRNEIQLVERVCVRKILRFAQSGVLYISFNKFFTKCDKTQIYFLLYIDGISIVVIYKILKSVHHTCTSSQTTHMHMSFLTLSTITTYLFYTYM